MARCTLLVAALAFAAAQCIAQAANATDEMNTTSTTTSTTTTQHECVANNPCAANADCVEDGDGHVCVCKLGFTGVESNDGDSCQRTAITSKATLGKQGLHITVGEGADLHVRAGGPLRGKETSIFKLDQAIQTLLGDGDDVGLVQANTDRVTVLDAKVDGQRRTLAADIADAIRDLTQLFMAGITQAEASIGNNGRAIEEETGRALAAERVLGDTIAAEGKRAITAETALTSSAAAEATRAKAAEAVLTNNLEAESKRAKAAEATLTTSINNEQTRATSAENQLAASVTQETGRAKGEEGKIRGELGAAVTQLGKDIKAAEARSSTEAKALVAAETKRVDALLAKRPDQTETVTLINCANGKQAFQISQPPEHQSSVLHPICMVCYPGRALTHKHWLLALCYDRRSHHIHRHGLICLQA